MLRTGETGAKGPRRRRLIGLSIGLAVAMTAYLVVANPFVSATSGGDPYSVPVVTDTNPAANIVETSITAEEATVDIGNGVQAKAQTFNGQIPGPTFQLNVGDTVIVHYANHLSRVSGIHWHGIELANSMDGTPFTQDQVQPGGNFIYKFTVHRPGIFWYHPHHHSSTNQVFKGLYGMVLVKDPSDAALQSSGVLPPASQTKPIVLSDITVCKAKGSNDATTYKPGEPWVGGAVLPAQQPPTPKNLCEGPSVEKPAGVINPYPIDEDGNARGSFAAGDVPNIQSLNHAGPTNEGQTVLTNGRNVGGRAGSPCQPLGCPPHTKPGALSPNASLLNVQPGQGLRLQLLNASATRYFRLQLADEEGAEVPLVRVGGEGGLLDKAVLEGGEMGTWKTGYLAGEILLPPGSRADVVAAIPNTKTSGVLTLWTEDFERSGLGFTNTPTVPVMHLNLSGPKVGPYTIANGTPLLNSIGKSVEKLGAPTGTVLNPATFNPAKKGLATPSIDLTSNAQKSLGINNVFGEHDGAPNYMDAAHLDSSRYVKEGDTLALEVKNVTGADHPFHLHGFSIQPISLSNGGETFEFVPEFRDNVNVPPGFTLKFKVRIDPRAQPDGTTSGGALGRWLLHCHIFFHATDGMLSELVVTAPNGNERPDVNVSTSEPPPVEQGKTATLTGTYRDPDGDPVTLSASVGSVADTGGGNYTWSFPTSFTQGDQLVYITATDSNGLKGQIPFQLRTTPNQAPVMTQLKTTPKTFAAGKARTKLNAIVSKKKKRRKRGTKIRFNLSEPAKVQFTLKRVKPKKPKVKAPPFSREVTKAGGIVIAFSGRFKRKKPLPPGRYRLTAQGTDGGGLLSQQLTTTFKIVR
jgi:FtsP/CotA-like multicopper oxidase with cupredoxin domain